MTKVFWDFLFWLIVLHVNLSPNGSADLNNYETSSPSFFWNVISSIADSQGYEWLLTRFENFYPARRLNVSGFYCAKAMPRLTNRNPESKTVLISSRFILQIVIIGHPSPQGVLQSVPQCCISATSQSASLLLDLCKFLNHGMLPQRLIKSNITVKRTIMMGKKYLRTSGRDYERSLSKQRRIQGRYYSSELCDQGGCFGWASEPESGRPVAATPELTTRKVEKVGFDSINLQVVWKNIAS